MVKGLHLPPRYREEIVALLHKHLPGVEVWAYGSRVNGRSHDGSDLDLVLRGPKLAEIDTSQLAGITESFRKSTVPFLIEARDWARLPKRFHREIEREHVVLVGEDQDGYGQSGRPSNSMRISPLISKSLDMASDWNDYVASRKRVFQLRTANTVTSRHGLRNMAIPTSNPAGQGRPNQSRWCSPHHT